MIIMGKLCMILGKDIYDEWPQHAAQLVVACSRHGVIVDGKSQCSRVM